MHHQDHVGLEPLQVELREAMEGWGCPLCQLASRAEYAYVASLSYERVLDLATRDRLQAARGLCAQHTRIWQHLQGSALGMAIVHRVTLLDLLRDTESHAGRVKARLWRRRDARDVADRLEPAATCPACEIGAGVSRRFGELLLDDIVDPDVESLLVGCGGVCLPHLRRMLRLQGAPRKADALLRAQREAWECLMADLDEFIRKNDYRFAGEAMTDAEALSWTRALDLIVGLDE